jgi:hypothetical protein
MALLQEEHFQPTSLTTPVQLPYTLLSPLVLLVQAANRNGGVPVLTQSLLMVSRRRPYSILRFSSLVLNTYKSLSYEATQLVSDGHQVNTGGRLSAKHWKWFSLGKKQ